MAAESVTPYLVMRDAARAIGWYVRVFGASEDFRLAYPDGRIGHAELLFGSGRLCLADEHPDFGALGPVSIGGTPVSLHVYVPDADATLALGEAEGGTVLRAAKDEFYGDRSGMLLDPFGHKWHVSTRKETVSAEEMQKRFSALLAGT